MANEKIKQLAKAERVRHWEIADRLQMHDSNFSRKLRHELSPEETTKIIEIIYQIKECRLFPTKRPSDI